MFSRAGIVGDVARCIYDEDWAIYEENVKNHISAACFEVVANTKNQTIDFIASCVKAIGTKTIIGFSEGADQTVIALATIVGYKLGIPSFKIMTGENDKPLLRIPDDFPASSLLLSYISTKDQLSEILDKVKSIGGNVRQVIVLVDEDSQAESICRQKKTDFKRLTTLSEVFESIRRIPSADSIRVQMLGEMLSRQK